jgi:hypothetical protein
MLPISNFDRERIRGVQKSEFASAPFVAICLVANNKHDFGDNAEVAKKVRGADS